jgi:hypothetical protein
VVIKKTIGNEPIQEEPGTEIPSGSFLLYRLFKTGTGCGGTGTITIYNIIPQRLFQPNLRDAAPHCRWAIDIEYNTGCRPGSTELF